MLNTNHPDDERLSALAARDEEATADGSLTSHLSSCSRCADVVTELTVLRSSLAELPDLKPSRPLQLLPPVADASAAADGFAGWIRRLFAPVVTAGTALALVGVVGTAMPSMGGMADSADSAAGGAALEAAPGDSAADGLTFEAARGSGGAAAPSDAESVTSDDRGRDEAGQATEDEDRLATELPAERSPWPMVLFTGVALVVAAAVLRWIVVPRAG